MPNNQTINIFVEDVPNLEIDLTSTTKWLKVNMSILGHKHYELNFILCSDNYLLNMNRKFLNHDYYTDVITFDNSEEGTDYLEGDIFISLDRVRDNANDVKISFYEELCRVFIHGVLHLSGYNDKTEEEVKAMRAAEDKFLALHPKLKA